MSMALVFAIPVALLSAALMGMAIQRGATCMVAAVDEVLTTKRCGRALALGEAALWVGGLLALAQLAGWIAMAPARYPVALGTVIGGVLLGLGAWINRACVFGAVARIGSGQVAYLATPIGFFLGCLAPLRSAPALPAPGQAFAYPWAVAFGFLLLALWRVTGAIRAPDRLGHVWHPHRATLLIGITFVTTLLTVGAWAYTDALAALAHAMDARLGLRTIMVAALLAGAVAGGLIAGNFRLEPVRAANVLRCLAGGGLMGLGAMLVPGSNDGLIMLGLPLLQPHAWVAVATMAASIAAAIALAPRLARIVLQW